MQTAARSARSPRPENRAPHRYLQGPEIAGFALIRGLVDQPRVLGEFFVVGPLAGYAAVTAALSGRGDG
ncbi:MAG TPA: hypothetical protein VGJ38_12450 [Jatrophihabitantaceae bacterium]